MADFRTPLSRVKGLGSARDGTDHFWAQRVTAIANLFMLAFLIYTAISLAGQPLSEVRDYFSSPIVAGLAVLFVLAASYHMRIGMQVIVEDYVHSHGSKTILLLLNTFFCAAVGLISVVAILKLNFGA
ncbi:MAG: succinate dehydrogenase, hydrophobic membrane anchor protein [Hyphomicrobiales bacterium]|nr:succinate dehydrogenase, hydrophobic membrane anchor protein [Hyphomicrobiales bacterium]